MNIFFSPLFFGLNLFLPVSGRGKAIILFKEPAHMAFVCKPQLISDFRNGEVAVAHPELHQVEFVMNNELLQALVRLLLEKLPDIMRGKIELFRQVLLLQHIGAINILPDIPDHPADQRSGLVYSIYIYILRYIPRYYIQQQTYIVLQVLLVIGRFLLIFIHHIADERHDHVTIVLLADQ